LRKYFVAAVAATTTLAFGTTAVAQAPEASQTVTVSPTKAGTKKKPKSVKLHLKVTNNNTRRTASKLTIAHSKTVVLSGKGFPTCSADTLEHEGKQACPAKSKVGTGDAKALLGVNTAAPKPLTFKVTAYVAGAKGINFFLEGVELPGLKLVAPGEIKGRKLIVTIPAAAQQPVPGTWAGLSELDTTIGAKIKKNAIVATTGCKKKKHPFSTTITFVDNGVQPAGNVTAEGAAACKA
jgi:hypothetical protein